MSAPKQPYRPSYGQGAQPPGAGRERPAPSAPAPSAPAPQAPGPPQPAPGHQVPGYPASPGYQMPPAPPYSAPGPQYAQSPAPPQYAQPAPSGYPPQQPSSDPQQSAGSPRSDAQQNALPPQNYMIFAVCTLLLCCNPVGIYAVIKAGSVNKLWQLGHEDEARKASEAAKTWSLIALAAGLAWSLIWIFVNFFLFAASA